MEIGDILTSLSLAFVHKTPSRSNGNWKLR